MKIIALALSLVLSTNAFATTANTQTVLDNAIDVIGDKAETGVFKHNLSPNADPKEMLWKLVVAKYENGALREEFEESWTDNSSRAWEVDSSLWALTDLQEAQAYIVNNLYENENIDSKAEVIKIKKAFEVLSKMPNVAYGIAPEGAVQCGVQFPELVIMDLETGIVYEIAMEGSGC